MEVVIYTRASTDESTNLQKITIPAQIKACERFCNDRGLNVKGVIKDRISTDVEPLKRDGFKRAMKLLSAGDILLVNERDRLGRTLIGNQLADKEIFKLGCDLVAVKEGSAHDNYFQNVILDLTAEQEKKKIGERTSQALQYNKENNIRWTNIAPIGVQWTKDNKCIKNDKEVEMIEDIQKMRSSGMSFKDIAIQCELRRYLNRAGNVPSQSALSKICKGIGIEIDRNLDGRKARKRLEDSKAGMKEYIISFKTQGLSMRKIANELNEMGYRTSKGGEIRHTQIARILKNLD